MAFEFWHNQNSFVGGFVSSSLYDRVDIPQVTKALSFSYNFVTKPHGTIYNRPGTFFAVEVKDSSKKTRVIEMNVSKDDGYCIELGHLYARFLYRGEQLESSPGVPAEVVTEFPEAVLFEIDYIQTGDILELYHKDYRPKRIRRLAADGSSWDIENVEFIDGPYLPLNTDEAHTLESSGATGSVTVVSTVDMFAATDVGRLIRKFDSVGGEWGWGEITAYTDAKTVTVTIVEGEFQLTPTDLWRIGKFSETTGWPGTAMYYEQRKCVGGSKSNPQDVDFSKSEGKFTMYGSALDGILLLTDGAGFTLYSDQIDDILWMRPTKSGLAIGTAGAPWLMHGSGGKDDPISPASIDAKPHDVVSSHESVKPVTLDNAVLFLDKSGKHLYEFAYSWEDEKYTAGDMSVLAEDMFIGRGIVDQASNSIEKIIWNVLDDGNLAGFTFMRKEKIRAWHEHGFDNGAFESVCSVSEGRRETEYFVVKRTINGVEKRYIEYFAPEFESDTTVDAYHLDCGIESIGTTITGLDHLEGEDVMAIVDGKVVDNLQVSSGQVVLPYEGVEKVYVGMYTWSRGATIPPELESTKGGSTIGRTKDISTTLIRVARSYGCWLGRDLDNMQEVKFNQNAQFSTAPELFTGVKGLDSIGGQPARELFVWFEQRVPLPLQISSLQFKVIIDED